MREFVVTLLMTMTMMNMMLIMIDAAIGAHGRGSRLVHYLTVAAPLDKSLTSHCM